MSESKEPSAWGLAFVGGLGLMFAAFVGVFGSSVLQGFASALTPSSNDVEQGWTAVWHDHALVFGSLITLVAAVLIGAWIARRKRYWSATILGTAFVFVFGLILLMAIGGFFSHFPNADFHTASAAGYFVGSLVGIFLVLLIPLLLALAGLWAGALLSGGRRKARGDWAG